MAEFSTSIRLATTPSSAHFVTWLRQHHANSTLETDAQDLHSLAVPLAFRPITFVPALKGSEAESCGEFR